MLYLGRCGERPSPQQAATYRALNMRGEPACCIVGRIKGGKTTMQASDLHWPTWMEIQLQGTKKTYQKGTGTS